MKDPYLIGERASISVSGGRTSGYMLWRILQAHGGVLPDHITAVFANTGKEMPQTLDFVRDMSVNWGVDIVWLELGEYAANSTWITGVPAGMDRYKATTKIVDYDTASRNGEPFERLVLKRNYLPNIVSRFCTAELKVRRIRDYLKSTGAKDWIQCIGIRADEPRRAAKMHGKIDEGHEMYCPLFLDGVTKEMVGDFWRQQSFDLQLPNNNGVTDWGNCDLCFLKGHKKKLAIIRARPDLAEWWIDIEEKMSGNAGQAARFRNDQPSYAEMKIIATDQGRLFDEGNDETIPCFCGD